MATTSVRSNIDCREFPSEKNCTLKISGAESEVLAVALQHAIASHKHADTPELREALRTSLRQEAAS